MKPVYITINPATLNATFSFDSNTGQIINKVSTPELEVEFDSLIKEAEQISNNPDHYIYFK